MQFKKFISLNEFYNNQDEDDFKKYLNFAFERYLKEGVSKPFFNTLKISIKSRSTIKDFAKKIGISRDGLHCILSGEKEPRTSTLEKILNELGLKLKIE